MSRCILAVACLVGLAVVGSAWGAVPAVVLKVGQSRSFTAARLAPGEKVSCVNHGHVLSVDAPASPAISNGTVWTQPGATHFYLHVTAKIAGGYTADCGLGGFHWKTATASTRPDRPTHSYLAI